MKHVKTLIKARDNALTNLPFYVIASVITAISFLHIAGFAGSFMPRVISEVRSSHDSPVVVPLPVSNEGHVPSAITIKKVDISLPVVSVPLVNGTWVVNEGVANYAEGTSLISDKDGNVGIFAHDRANGFTRIKELAIGDQVEVKTNDGYIALYTIVSKYDTIPSNVEEFNVTDEPTLTLVTCNGAFSEQRHIVKAKLVSLKQIMSYEYNF